MRDERVSIEAPPESVNPPRRPFFSLGILKAAIDSWHSHPDRYNFVDWAHLQIIKNPQKWSQGLLLCQFIAISFLSLQILPNPRVTCKAWAGRKTML